MATFRHLVEVATQRAQENMEAARRSAERMRDGFREADESADRLGHSAGRVGSSAGKLAGVLDRVSPGLGEVARLTADGADAMEVAADGTKALSLSFTRLLTLLGPIAAAVGLLGGAYLTLKKQLDDANEAMQTAAERATTMAEAHAQVREQALLAAVATGKLSEQEFARIAAAKTAEDLFAAQRANQRDRLQGAQEEIRSLQAQREAIEENIATLERAKKTRREVSTQGGAGILAGNDQVSTAGNLALQERALANINAKLAEQTQIVRTAGTSMNILSEATDRYAADVATVAISKIKDTTEAVRELTEVLGDVDLTTLGRVTGAEGAPAVVNNLGSQVDALVVQGEAERAARRQQVLGGISTGIGAISNPTAALGLLGPAGGILQGVAAIGGMGAEGVEERLDQLLDGLTGGLEALPEIIGEVLPGFVAALATELPIAILKTIPAIAQAIWNAIRGRDGAGGGTTDAGQAAIDASNAQQQQARGGGVDAFSGPATARSSRASTVGRLARAQGASRLAIARAPTMQGVAGLGTTIQVNQLGPADATQDSYLRTLARLQDTTTGLRG